MDPVVLGRWMQREWLKALPAPLALPAVALLGPLVAISRPWGIASDRASSDSYVCSIWYLSALVGATVGLWLLARGETVWAEMGALKRCWASTWVLAIATSVHALVALGSTAATVGAVVVPWVAFLMCVAHWVSLGVFAHRTNLGPVGSWVLLLALGWWTPALLPEGLSWDRASWLLDPARHLALGFEPLETSIRVLVDTMPIVAWWVAAALLPTRSGHRR